MKEVKNESKLRLEEMTENEIGVLSKQIISCDAQVLLSDEWMDIPHNYAQDGCLNINFKAIYRTKPRKLSVNDLYQKVKAYDDSAITGLSPYTGILELIRNTEGFKEIDSERD